MFRFLGKVVVKSGNMFDFVQTAVHFNRKVRGGNRMPSIAKKTLLGKNTKISLEFIPKDDIKANELFTVCRKN